MITDPRPSTELVFDLWLPFDTAHMFYYFTTRYFLCIGVSPVEIRPILAEICRGTSTGLHPVRPRGTLNFRKFQKVSDSAHIAPSDRSLDSLSIGSCPVKIRSVVAEICPRTPFGGPGPPLEAGPGPDRTRTPSFGCTEFT